MSFFKRRREGLGGAKPIDDLAKAYPHDAFTAVHGLSPYPKKTRISDQGVFAYRLEFMVAIADAALVVDALQSEFDVGNGEVFQEGQARNGEIAVHFSIREEFGGAVVVMLTNSASLLARIDALRLEPPPPWSVFADSDPSTLSSLQGAMEYWWDWLFLPFWAALDDPSRSRYLEKHAVNEDWLEFLKTHAP